MIREDIIRMAHEARLCDASGDDDNSIYIVLHLEHFAKLVVAAEREACAKLCEDDSILYAWRSFAEAIRARGPK